MKMHGTELIPGKYLSFTTDKGNKYSGEIKEVEEINKMNMQRFVITLDSGLSFIYIPRSHTVLIKEYTKNLMR